MTEWNIQSRAHECAACGKHFADKETFHTLLFAEKSELRRSDLCQPCWQQHNSDADRAQKGFISYWHSVYQAPPPPTETIQKDTAETLLRKLIALNDPNYMPAGYILAVMLERKRLLKVKQQTVLDGKRVFVYEHPKSGDVFTIADPNLQLNQLEKVQHDVANLLEHGLNLPAPETAAPAESPESAAGEADPTPQPPAPEAQGEPQAPAGEAPSESADSPQEPNKTP
jgi:hypothetical protein